MDDQQMDLMFQTKEEVIQTYYDDAQLNLKTGAKLIHVYASLTDEDSKEKKIYLMKKQGQRIIEMKILYLLYYVTIIFRFFRYISLLVFFLMRGIADIFDDRLFLIYIHVFFCYIEYVDNCIH
jgi:hypothetical protein